MREGCFELYGLWTLFPLSCARVTSGYFNYHAIRKKLRHICAIQGTCLIWKKIYLIGYLWTSLFIDQSECLLYYFFFCIQLPLSCTVLRKNCTVLSQSESSNFFMYIIRSEIICVIVKLNERAVRVWFEITRMILDQNCTPLSSTTIFVRSILRLHKFAKQWLFCLSFSCNVIG